MKKLILFSCLFYLMFLSVNIVSAGDSPPIDSKMILFHQFNNDTSLGENYGTTTVVNDSFNNNGTYSGSPVYNATGGFLMDGAFNFDGTNDYISAGNKSNLNSPNITQQLTICVWVNKYNHKNLADDDGGIIYKSGQYTVYFYNQSLNFRIWSAGATKTGAIKSGFPLNEWHWGCGVYNGTNVLTSYDGSTLSNQLSASVLDTGIGTLYFGAEFSGGTTYFNGSLDDAIIYNRSLNSNEIKQIYGWYMGTECNSSIIGTCNVSNSLTLDGNDIYQNGSSIGVIQINSNNIILDCNGSTFHGNKSSGSIAIYNSIYDNVTIKNCNIYNYSTGIYLYNGANNGFIINNTVGSGIYDGISLRYSLYNIVSNNTIKDSGDGLGLANSNYNNYSYNILENISSYGLWIRLTSNNNIFHDNNIKNVTTYGVFVDSGYSNTFYNNQIDYSGLYAHYFYNGAYSNYAYNETMNFVGANYFNSGTAFAFQDSWNNLAENSSGTEIRGVFLHNSTGDAVKNSIFNETGFYNASYYYPYAIYVDERSNNFTYNNNYYYNYYNNSGGYSLNNFKGWDNSKITNSYFLNTGRYASNVSTNETLYNSTFIDTQYQFYWVNDINMNVSKSTFSYTDWILIINVTNMNFNNNLVYNTTTLQDQYLTGVYFINSINFNILNNNFSEMGQNCILLTNSNNGIISNNYCDTVNLSKMTLCPINPLFPDNNPGNLSCFDQREEPNVGIGMVQDYKHYAQGSAYPVNATFRNYSAYNYSKSSNITMTNNTYGPNVQVILRSQGNNVFTTDISNVWFRSFRVNNMLDRDDFYISNNYDHISNINSTFNINDLMGIGSYWWVFNDLRYKIYKTYTYYYRSVKPAYITNDSGFGDIVTPLNQTDSLIFIVGSTGLYLTGANQNTTLNLNSSNGAYSLENFNCSESLQTSTGYPCGRENSPFLILSKNDDGKKVTYNFNSSLTNTVYNITFYPTISIPCGSLSSSYAHSVTTNCSGNLLQSVTFTNGLAPSTTSLTLDYYQGSSTGGGGGTGLDPDYSGNETQTEINKLYNVTYICEQTKAFKKLYKNYSANQFLNFKYQLELRMGKAISESSLKLFINDFNTMCPAFVDSGDTTTPTPGGNEDGGYNYIPLIVFVGVIILVVLIILVFQSRNHQPEDRIIINTGGL